MRLKLSNFGSTNIVALVCFVATAGLLAGFWLGKYSVEPPLYVDRAKRIGLLIEEMTKTAERQQAALDEIARDGDGAYMYLLPYLKDVRPLAFDTIKLLSTHPNRTEKHSMLGAKTVGEAVLRYLCWSTESCDFSYDSSDEKMRATQVGKVTEYCQTRWLAPAKI